MRSGVSALRRDIGWSALYIAVTRVSTLAAVPVILDALGTELYAAWVMAGTLIMAQGLVDLGVGAAVIRYVAVGAAEDSREAVGAIIRRAGLFYAALSLTVGVPLVAFAEPMVGLVPYLEGREVSEAATLLRYVAASFALTNAVLVLGSALQGLNRVDASFRAQTLGWLLYVPILAGGLALTGAGAHPVGLAWVGAYTAQVLLLIAPLSTSCRRLGTGGRDRVPTLREMLSLGGRWQVSSWADFTTFQLPRLIGGISLTSAGLVALDLAIRFAQVVVTPLFAAYPVVLPKATAAVTKDGRAGLRRLLDRWVVPGAIVVALGAAAALPLATPAIATWTGQVIDSLDPVLSALVLIGIVGHASTGLFSSALLATGEIRSVVVYKARQLVLAAALLVPAALLGPLAVALALAVALLLPAVAFNLRAARILDVTPPMDGKRLVGKLAGGAALCAAVPGAVLALTDLSPLGGLTAASVASASMFLLALRWCAPWLPAPRRRGRAANPIQPERSVAGS